MIVVHGYPSALIGHLLFSLPALLYALTSSLLHLCACKYFESSYVANTEVFNGFLVSYVLVSLCLSLALSCCDWPNLTPLLCRGGRAGCLAALVEMLDDLAHVGLALLFTGRRADCVECVRRLDEDGIVDDDLGVGPAGRETRMVGSAVWDDNPNE